VNNSIQYKIVLEGIHSYARSKMALWLHEKEQNYENIHCLSKHCVLSKSQLKEIANKHQAFIMDDDDTWCSFHPNFIIYAVLSDDKFFVYYTEEFLDNLKEFDVFEDIGGKEGKVLWFYKGIDGIKNSTMDLRGNNPHPSFYPWIENLNQLYDDYINSPASVLLLIGSPGTGKSTFIRGLIRHSGMDAWVTYDSQIQQDESLYIKFSKFSKSNDYDDVPVEHNNKDCERGRILVMEDADEMLSGRRDGNKLMTRILNISDGLVELPKRKIIFSTNLPSISSIDEALLRPGRCFGVINFRELTQTEGAKIQGIFGVKGEVLEPNRSYTLSRVLNSSHNNGSSVRKIGFH
jgi:ATPase family associated with various cellular activities (AAA)